MPIRNHDRGYSRGEPPRRVFAQTTPPMHTTRRSWTDGGVHYTMETTSFNRPGISFGATSGMVHSQNFAGPSLHLHSHPPAFPMGTGLLGGAFGLLDDLMSPVHPIVRQPVRQVYLEEVSSSESEDDRDDDLRSEEVRTHRPRSFFSRFKDAFSDGRQHRRATSYDQDPPSSGRRYRDHHEDETSNTSRHRSERDGPGDDVNLTDTIEALESAWRHHDKEVRRCKKQLEQASRYHSMNSNDLQSLLDMLKWQEAARNDALRDIQNAKAQQSGSTRPSAASSQHARPEPPRRSSSRRTTYDDLHDPFFGTPFGFLPQQRASTHPLFMEADELDPFPGHIFGNFGNIFNSFGAHSPLHDGFDHFFAMPGMAHGNAQRKRPRFSTAHDGTVPRPDPYHDETRAQTPPSTVLTLDEAKRLYTMYNVRWSELSTSDPDIPFPTRGLRASALLNHDTLWAPGIGAHPSQWSEETTMQANTQAFFLGVVDMHPQYSEAPGRVTMGFDKARASSAQVERLMEVLKKEKTRWHSDRLGRRNNGNEGVNVALQQNEQARAVFHAVCELMEVAQGRGGT